MTDLRNLRKELQMAPVQRGTANPSRKIVKRISSFMHTEICVERKFVRSRRVCVIACVAALEVQVTSAFRQALVTMFGCKS